MCDLQLGTGTFAATKKAYWSKGDKEVAVKIIKKDLLQGEAASQVQDELSLLEGLEHPNIGQSQLHTLRDLPTWIVARASGTFAHTATHSQTL